MKKLFLSITVIMLAIILPLTANAATITAASEKEKSEATIGEVIDVTVKLDEKEVESMQFDLKYNNKIFQYVQESAESDLNSTLSHEIEPGVVRVSVIDDKVDGKTDNEVTMKFKAIGEGKKAEFSIVDGSVEVGKSNGKIAEKVKNPTVKIDNVFTNTGNGGNSPAVSAPQYVNSQGQVITALPKTGEKATSVSASKNVRSIDGIYGTLGNLKNVVLYALPTSDDTISVDAVKAEFGKDITTNIKDIVKTGDTFTIDGTKYTIIVYGDVNCDGKVTTYDALIAKKIKLGKNVSEYAREAANIEKSSIDTKAMQKFILRLRKTATNTILDKFPENPGKNTIKDVTITSANKSVILKTTTIAKIKSTNSVPLTVDMFKYEIEEAPAGVDTTNIISCTAESGSLNVKLTAPKAGNYKIIPIISGNNVQNGYIKKDPIIVIVEDNTVNGVELYVGNDKLDMSEQAPYEINDGKDATITLKYLHDTTDVTDTLESAQVTIESVTDVDGVLKTNSVKLNNSNKELVVSANSRISGTAAITLNITNADGQTYQKTIYVEVKEPRIIGLKWNGNDKLINGFGTTELNLYTYKAEDIDDKVQEFTTDKGKAIYTIIDVAKLNENYVADNPNSTDGYTDILAKDLKLASESGITAHSLVIDEQQDATDKDINICALKKTGNTYSLATGDEKISAIGIAFAPNSDETGKALVVGQNKIIVKYANTDFSINVNRKDEPEPEKVLTAIKVDTTKTEADRFAKTPIGTIKSNTQDAILKASMIKYTAVGPDGEDAKGMVSIEETDVTGVFNIYLTPTKVTAENKAYTIKPYAEVNGAVIKDATNETLSITVKEVETVNYAEIYVDGKKVSTSESKPYMLSNTIENIVTFEMKYFHDYNNGTDPVEITGLTSENITKKITETVTGIVDENQTYFQTTLGNNVTNGNSETEPINRLRVKTNSSVVGKVTIELQIKNSVNATPHKEYIYLQIAQPQLESITLNSTSTFTKTSTEPYSLDLYTSPKTGDAHVKSLTVTDDNVSADGIYTIVDLALNSNVGSIKILPDSITNGQLSVDGVNGTDMYYITVAPLTIDYKGAGASDAVTALGFAILLPDAEDDGELENLTGLSITYGDITIPVNISCVPGDAGYGLRRAAPAKQEHIHTFDNGTVITPATCAEVGKTEFKCTTCDYKETRDIEKLSTHKYENGVCTVCKAECKHTNTTDKVVKEATCKDAGSKEVVCTECSTVVKVNVVIDKLTTHKYDENGVCAVCGEKKTTSVEEEKKEEAKQPETPAEPVVPQEPAPATPAQPDSVTQTPAEPQNPAPATPAEPAVPQEPAPETPAEPVVPQDQTPETPAA